MFPIPQKVKNVTVSPYIGGPRPVPEPVLVNGVGTYAVGTLLNCVSHTLELSSADPKYPLYIHDLYYAECEDEQGRIFRTAAMYCIEKGATPKFSVSKCIGKPGGSSSATLENLSVPPFNVLAALTDVTVSQLFPGNAIGQIPLITGATGNIIATVHGTPHLMGVEVRGGMRSEALYLGMGGITITGKLPNGRPHTVSHYTCVSTADPAIFLMSFPG